MFTAGVLGLCEGGGGLNIVPQKRVEALFRITIKDYV
jgi:hypothetical protein